MLLFGAACVLGYPYVSPVIKGWLGRRHLPALRQFSKEQDWTQAIGKMHEARRWAPDDPEVLRASSALIFEAGGDPRSVTTQLMRLQETMEATPADLALMGRAHVRLDEITAARALLDQLPESPRQQSTGLRLQADKLPAGQRVVYAGLLKLSGGEPGRVFRLVERAPVRLLPPEDKVFLQHAQ